MKKNQKSLESPSIRSYEHVVKRVLLNNLIFILLFGLLSSHASAATSLRATFVVLKNEVIFDDAVETLEKAGARVRQRIPPHIMVADIPTNVSLSSLLNTQSVYTGLFVPQSLNSYGPLAVAAAHQWNRQFVTQAQSAGAKSFSSMRVMAAQKSFPRLTDLQAAIEGKTIRLSWSGLDGARAYEIEAAENAAFTERLISSRSNIPSTVIALPMGRDHSLFVRVRALDHLETEHKAEEDVVGAWSNVVNVGIPLLSDGPKKEAPTLSSPQDNFETEGFTVILEWNDPSISFYRVQLSRTADFKETLIDGIADTREFIVPSQALHVRDSLYWRVQKWGEESSSWSESRRIRIGAPQHTQTDMFIDPSVSQ